MERVRLRRRVLAEDASDAISNSCLTKGPGRPFDEHLLKASVFVKKLVEEESPMTVRHVFYRLAGIGLVDKDDAGYQKVVRLLKTMRTKMSFKRRYPHLALDFNHISEEGRRPHRTYTVSGPAEAVESLVYDYRLSVLDHADTYIEVWVEKDAMVGTIYPVCQKYDVPLIASKGYSSITALHRLATRIMQARALGKPTVLLQLGDWDHDGRNIPQTMNYKIREMLRDNFECYDPELEIKRIALTEKQIKRYKLPTRPNKKTGESTDVDLDAMRPSELRQLLDKAISLYIPQDLVSEVREREKAHKRQLRKLADKF